MGPKIKTVTMCPALARQQKLLALRTEAALLLEDIEILQGLARQYQPRSKTRQSLTRTTLRLQSASKTNQRTQLGHNAWIIQQERQQAGQ